MKQMQLLCSAALVFLFLNINIQAQEQTQLPAKDEQVRLVYGLVVDNSGSIRSSMYEVSVTGKLIVNSQKSGDDAFIVRFVDSEKIKTLQDFTSNKAALHDALDTMYVEGGNSAIVDALHFSLRQLSRERSNSDSASRRVLILITDGDERASFYTLEQVLKLVRQESVRVYAMGFVQTLKPHGINTQKRATALLNRIAAESGGRAFFPETSAEVRNIASALLDNIRNQ